MGMVLFLLLIPVATWMLALSDFEVEEGRMHAFVIFMLFSTLLTPDVQNAIVVCTTAIIEFEGTLYLLKKAHA